MQAVWVFAGGPAPAPPMDYTSVCKDDPKALCAITDKSGVLTAATRLFVGCLGGSELGP